MYGKLHIDFDSSKGKVYIRQTRQVEDIAPPDARRRIMTDVCRKGSELKTHIGGKDAENPDGSFSIAISSPINEEMIEALSV